MRRRVASVEGASIEAPQAPRGVGCGEGVFLFPLGVGSGKEAVPPPPENFWTFYLEIALFGAF